MDDIECESLMKTIAAHFGQIAKLLTSEKQSRQTGLYFQSHLFFRNLVTFVFIEVILLTAAKFLIVI